MPLYPVALLFSSDSIKDTRIRYLCIERDKAYYIEKSAYLPEQPKIKIEGVSQIEIFLNNMLLNRVIYQNFALPDGSRLIADAFDYRITGTSCSVPENSCNAVFLMAYGSLGDYIWARYVSIPVLELKSSQEILAAMYNPSIRYGFKLSEDNKSWCNDNITLPDNVLWFRASTSSSNKDRFNNAPDTILCPRQMMSIEAIVKKAIEAPATCSVCKIYSNTGAKIILPTQMFSLPLHRGVGGTWVDSGVLAVKSSLSSVFVDMSNYTDLHRYDIHIHSCIGDVANILLTKGESMLKCVTLPHTINISLGKTSPTFYAPNPTYFPKELGIAGAFQDNTEINIRGIAADKLRLFLGTENPAHVKINIYPDCKIGKLCLSSMPFNDNDALKITFNNPTSTEIVRV